VDCDLDRLGPALVDAIADLEFGLPEEWAIGFGSQSDREIEEVGVGRLAEGLVQPLGFFDLLGGQVGPGPGEPSVNG
jgi:hypothetical protein